MTVLKFEIIKCKKIVLLKVYHEKGSVAIAFI
jgi:hypothetical protein